MCLNSLHRRQFFIITSKLVIKVVYSLHVSCSTVRCLGKLPNKILDRQYENFLTQSAGVDVCCIVLRSEAEGLRMDNVKMKGLRFDYESSVKRSRGCGE
jgi:hypothetical protein